MKSTTAAAFLLGASLFALAAPALAQDTGATATDASKPAEGLGEIVVTANRVASSAQDTPIALNVYTGTALADQGVNTVRDLSQIDPSVNVTNSTGSAYVAVRGIASTDVTEIGDPSVPITRDGFFTNRSFAISSSFYDVARIEVLKGPQGTLQGRNSTGGLVSIVTVRPELRTGGYASAEAGNYKTFNGEAGVNVLLAPGFAVRASGTVLSHKGYRTSTGPAFDGDDENFKSGRIQALYKGDNGLSAWVSYQHDSRDVNGDAQFRGPLGGPTPDFGKAKVFTSDAPTMTKLTSDRARWELAYSADMGLNFIYSGGYDSANWRNQLDATGGYPANRQFRQQETPKTWNHEFRVSNDKGGKLFFQAGYFYFQEKNVVNSGIFNLDMTGPLFGPGGFLTGVPNADQSNRYGIKFDYNILTRSQALFGQVEYDLTDKLQLSLGGRYTWDKKVRTGNAVLTLPALAFPLCGNDFPAPGTCPPFPLTTPGNGNLSKGEPTWHVGFNYRPAAGSLIYAKYDRGYKSGGFNSNGSAPSVDYGPERLDSFEIGTKNSLMGNTLQLNASAFYFKYKGYQGSQFTAATSSGSGVFNVGNASIFGIEGSAVALVGKATRINFNATYLHTKFGDGITINNGATPPAAINISGNRLPNAPGFTASGGIEQELPVSFGTFTARVDAKYSSAFYYSVFNTADTQSPEYVLANASLKFAPENSFWEVQAYVRNVFDKQVLAYATQNFNAGANTYQFQAPRTFGVRGSVKF
ncbi:TonB-dependent receptor [Novosphingobium sp.]|uniref:TonB-dependent receptor n=1 Tax=Novosphingobium sp. TaxID=1874826 RepID=UPI003BAD3247